MMADLLRPTAEPLPLDRLRILVDRAARHLTPAEGTAIREALAGIIHNATTAVQGLHQRAAVAEDDLERARDIAVQLENETARLEHEQEGLLKATAKLINDVGYARHTLARDVLGWAEAREDMDLPQTVFYAVAEHRCDLARAERAEQQLAQVRELAEASNAAMHGSLCTCPGDCERSCGSRPLAWNLDPAAILAALDDAQQPSPTEGDAPVNWQAIARQRERELKQEGDRRNRAEQQLDRVRRVARNYPGLRHLHAALDDAPQPECTGCGDTGACAGGPCAHPNAPQPETNRECRASTSGRCLRETGGATACATEDGECTHGAPPPPADRCACGHVRAWHTPMCAAAGGTCHCHHHTNETDNEASR